MSHLQGNGLLPHRNPEAHGVTRLSWRVLDDFAETPLRQTEKVLSAYTYLAQDYFYQRYKMERNKFLLHVDKIKLTDKSNLEEVVAALDVFYIAEKLRLSCEIQSFRYSGAHEYENFMTKKLRIILVASLLPSAM